MGPSNQDDKKTPDGSTPPSPTTRSPPPLPSPAFIDSLEQTLARLQSIQRDLTDLQHRGERAFVELRQHQLILDSIPPIRRPQNKRNTNTSPPSPSTNSLKVQTSKTIQKSPSPPRRPKISFNIAPDRITQLVAQLRLVSVKVLLIPKNNDRPPQFMHINTADVRFDTRPDRFLGHVPDMRSFWGADGWKHRDTRPIGEDWGAIDGLLAMKIAPGTAGVTAGVWVEACVFKVLRWDESRNVVLGCVGEDILELESVKRFIRKDPAVW